MPKTAEGTFPSLGFHTETGMDCCGQCVIFGIQYKSRLNIYSRSSGERMSPAWETQQEAFEEFWENVQDKWKNAAESYFEDNLGEDEPIPTNCYAFSTITLIKNQDGLEQIPGLIDFLVSKGWNIDRENVNPKTGNTLVLMSYQNE